MTGLGGPPDLVPIICTYRAYFSSPETDPISGGYEAVLDPYRIYPMNAAAAQTPDSVSQQIYTASQQGDPNDFLLLHATPGLAKDWDPTRISLLHSICYYESRMGRLPCRWDDETFGNRRDVSYDTAPLSVWDPKYIHLTPAVYVPSAAAIDTSLYGDTNVTLLGPYGAGDAGVEIICYCKTVYVPARYVGLLLCAHLTPAEARNRLRRAIVDAAAEADYRPLIDWLHAAIVRSVSNTHSTLIVPEPSAPLPDTLLLQHRHQLFLSHLPRLDPSINRAMGTRIAETVEEVAVEQRETWLDNKQVP